MLDATIMVVDDDVELRQVVRLILTKAGYRVVEAADGREAISILGKSQADSISTILVDLQMPNVNGAEVIRHLKVHYPTVPFIVLTAEREFLLTEILAKEGVCDYLIKPVAKEKLLEAVRIAVGLHRLRIDQARPQKSGH
jgi:two-component system, chemotaxis family, chemotaxis protein CheY